MNKQYEYINKIEINIKDFQYKNKNYNIKTYYKVTFNKENIKENHIIKLYKKYKGSLYYNFKNTFINNNTNQIKKIILYDSYIYIEYGIYLYRFDLNNIKIKENEIIFNDSNIKQYSINNHKRIYKKDLKNNESYYNIESLKIKLKTNKEYIFKNLISIVYDSTYKRIEIKENQYYKDKLTFIRLNEIKTINQLKTYC